LDDRLGDTASAGNLETPALVTTPSRWRAWASAGCHPAQRGRREKKKPPAATGSGHKTRARSRPQAAVFNQAENIARFRVPTVSFAAAMATTDAPRADHPPEHGHCVAGKVSRTAPSPAWTCTLLRRFNTLATCGPAATGGPIITRMPDLWPVPSTRESCGNNPPGIQNGGHASGLPLAKADAAVRYNAIIVIE